MLQELGASTDASSWAVASMLFFIAVYLVATVQVFRKRADEMDARARMALDPPSPEATEGKPWPGASEGRPWPEATEGRRLNEDAGEHAAFPAVR